MMNMRVLHNGLRGDVNKHYTLTFDTTSKKGYFSVCIE